MIREIIYIHGGILRGYSSILWTVDQCWNILHPSYAGWAMQGLLDAANNTNITTPAGTAYTWNNKAGSSNNTSPTEVTADEDGGHRRFAINIELAKKLNDGDESVKKKLETYWNETLSSDPNKLWEDEPFKVPVIILTFVGGMLGILFIMGMIIIFKIDDVKPFIITGISFSVLASTSTFSTLLPANGQDKMELKDVTITVANTGYEYYNFTALYQSSTSATPVTGATANTDSSNTVPGGGKKIPASSVQDNYHFKTNGITAQHAPRIRVINSTNNLNIQSTKLTKANVIEV